ncbi:MAG: ATP-binding cassette domain-containing protein [Clostridia bacterium]|nr:ATP-binding cassette domain-containing protein [Clostridia bacterium]
MISLSRVSKTFGDTREQVHAVNDVSLTVRRGEIYGIVGFSGAGKSTLVRLINLLEKPTAGTVTVGGVTLTSLKGRSLNRERQKIGMIFQQFNLFATRTVRENVAFPLRHHGLSAKAIREKVDSLLAYVELSEKADVYPSQLSGGQKQRVAIARALASDPQVLLCDEATSALDPQTTASILSLLRKLNQETGITIVVITHQMQVVKDICQRVAVMEKGRVVEEGDVYDIFSDPKEEITRNFVDTANNLTALSESLPDPARPASSPLPIPGGKRLKLRFLSDKATDAVVSHVSRLLNVDINIIAGNIEWIQGKPLGYLIVSVAEEGERLQMTIRALEENGVEVEVLENA